jgi:integrase
MTNRRRPRLPRGLHWDSKSPHIFFSWRDAQGKQHHQSTQETDPIQAQRFKLDFLERQRQNLDEIEYRTDDLTVMPLGQVSELYFKWKMANNSLLTVARERRMFKNVLKFFGAQRPASSVKIASIRQYQEKRRSQVSSTMKTRITTRTVNYEIQLLRGVMIYADCWTDQLQVRYKPLRQVKSRVGKTADKDQLMQIIATAKTNDYWQLAMYCAAVAVGTGCRSCEIRNLRLQDINLEQGKITIRGEVAKNRRNREPRLMALAEWGLRELLLRAQALGATQPQHYLLPLNLRKSRNLAKGSNAKWDINRPMTSWVKSWRKLMAACNMTGFRFHDLRHTFRTLGAEAGVPLEVMMAQLGHMDRETSLDYVHIQQRALEKAKQLIESEQQELLSVAQGKIPQKRIDSAESKPALTLASGDPLLRR